MKTTKKQISDGLAKKIERDYGVVELLKIGVSSINKLLTEKGICAATELRNSFIKEAEVFLSQKK